MARTLNYSQRLVVEVCCKCGIAFAIPEDFQRKVRRTSESFYCPEGHQQYYPGGKSDEAKIKELENELRRESDNAEFWRGQEAIQKRRVAAAKGRVTRIKNRIANGVCPCCNRHFENVERHMKNQHPDFTVVKDEVVG